MKSQRDILKGRLSVVGAILFCLFLLALLTPRTSAEIIITPTSVTTTSIQWEWTGPIIIQNLSIDGILVNDFNPFTESFTISDLNPDEPHTIMIITESDNGSNTSTTLPDNAIEKTQDLVSLVLTWWYLILIAVLCVIGMMRKLGAFLLIASMVSLYALIVFLQENTITGTDPLIQLPVYIYVAFFLTPLWLVWGVKGGVFK